MLSEFTLVEPDRFMDCVSIDLAFTASRFGEPTWLAKSLTIKIAWSGLSDQSMKAFARRILNGAAYQFRHVLKNALNSVSAPPMDTQDISLFAKVHCRSGRLAITASNLLRIGVLTIEQGIDYCKLHAEDLVKTLLYLIDEGKFEHRLQWDDFLQGFDFLPEGVSYEPAELKLRAIISLDGEHVFGEDLAIDKLILNDAGLIEFVKGRLRKFYFDFARSVNGSATTALHAKIKAGASTYRLEAVRLEVDLSVLWRSLRCSINRPYLASDIGISQLILWLEKALGMVATDLVEFGLGMFASLEETRFNWNEETI